MTLRTRAGRAIAIGFLLIAIAYSQSLADPFTPAKWIAVYFTAVLVLACTGLASDRESTRISIPVPGKQIGAAALIFSVLYAASFLANLPGAYENHVLDALVFVTLAGVTATAGVGLRDFRNELTIATIVVVGIGLAQYGGFEPFSGLSGVTFPSSTFGFQNMAAEFSALSLPTLFLGARRHFKSGFGLAVQVFLIAAVLGYVGLLHCRSADVALAFSLVPLVFLRWCPGCGGDFGKAIPIAGILVSVALFSVHSGIPIHAGEDVDRSANAVSALGTVKSGNVEIRKIRWRNTLELIRKNGWFGIGPGNFEFGYLPYRAAVRTDPEATEEMVVRSPHNGYLEAAAESGIPFLIAVIALLALSGSALVRRFLLERTDDRAFVLSVALFIAVDAIFAFPMENAFPFAFAAFATGMAIPQLSHSRVMLSHRLIRLSSVALAMVLATAGVSFGFSKWVESNGADQLSRSELACEWFPSNWRVCLSAARLETESKNLEAAEKTLRRALRLRPNLFPAMRLLAYAEFEKGDALAGCLEVRRYDALFGEGNTLRQARDRLCDAALPTVDPHP